ncbi:MAG: ABC transporter substrate-binding protein [Marinobacter sp. 34-60-7]|nr:MAG: ABC transporter substrate-binding protein [Marinobacter sp. 34-60-7]
MTSKRLTGWCWLLAVASSLSVLCSGLSANQEADAAPVSVTVGINHSPPYRIFEGADHSGLYLEIFEAMADHLGWQVHYREAPFRRLLLMMQQGEIDVMLGPLQTKRRESFMAFAVPAFPPERRLFFYLDDGHQINRYDDLYGRAIGVQEGAVYFDRFDTDEQLTKEPATNYENLMKMMQHGRVDVVIAPELVGLYTARRLGVEVKVSPFFVPGERSWIAVSRESPLVNQVDDLNAAFKRIELDGLPEDLILKYLETPAP